MLKVFGYDRDGVSGSECEKDRFNKEESIKGVNQDQEYEYQERSIPLFYRISAHYS